MEDIKKFIEASMVSFPRSLFKISEYKHPKYGKIWAAFVSLPNQENESGIINYVLFISGQGDEYRIVSTSLYTSAASDGRFYQWENNGGQNDITFETLGEPVRIERLKEPLDVHDSLKIYNENI